jgi:IS30 family transposase
MAAIGQLMARPKWMIGIKQRPKAVDSRSRFGDWERDTMYTKNRGFLLVCLERKSRLIKIAELKTHKAEEVAVTTTKLLKKAGRRVFTVTNDNGVEFR